MCEILAQAVAFQQGGIMRVHKLAVLAANGRISASAVVAVNFFRLLIDGTPLRGKRPNPRRCRSFPGAFPAEPGIAGLGAPREMEMNAGSECRVGLASQYWTILLQGGIRARIATKLASRA